MDDRSQIIALIIASLGVILFVDMNLRAQDSIPFKLPEIYRGVCKKALAVSLTQQERLDWYLQAARNEGAVRQNKRDQTECLIAAGQTSLRLGVFDAALRHFEEAFLACPSKEEILLGSILVEMALIHNKRGDHAKALTYFQRDLDIRKKWKDSAGQMSTLHNIAIVYNDIGDMKHAREIYEQLIRLEQRTNNPLFYAASVNNLAFVYFRLGNYQKAAALYQQAYLIGVRAKLPEIQAPTSIGLGDAYLKLGKTGSSLLFYQRGLALAQSEAVSNKVYEGDALYGIGNVYQATRDYPRALDFLFKALDLQRSLSTREEEGRTLISLMSLWSEMGLPDIAILYGKEVVNLNQKIRQNIKSLGDKLQRLYLRFNETTYRTLANLLISRGRLSEAEEVLSMLKEEETFSYVRRDDTVADKMLLTVSLSDREKAALTRYKECADEITHIGKEFNELDVKRKKYDEGDFTEQARYDELKAQLADATIAFQKYLDELKVTFGQKDERVMQVDSSLQNTLKRLDAKRTAVVSTIVGEDRLNLIVTTANTQRAHTIDKPAKEINQLVAEFRKALTDPRVDPHSAGQKLYDILVKPVEGDLKGIDADTVLWSLDGTLRYIPVAAIWDKDKGYLAERFSSVVLTLASRDTLGLPVSDKTAWNALGVGVSKPTEGFTELKAVPDELDCIITDQQSKTVSTKPKCTTGVVNGKKLLDEKFTATAFENALGRYPIVHIASHFSLNPGNDKDSFLLLGGGDQRKFTVENLRNVSLTDVELIVLSACNTATPGGEKANGVEIEGFGAVAQKQGAKAVMATLWPVADESTRDLMVRFYELYDKSGLTKAEAMRKAQLEMLRSKVSLTALCTTRAEPVDTANHKQYKCDPNVPYAHPYYWAPFVLFGNWR